MFTITKYKAVKSMGYRSRMLVGTALCLFFGFGQTAMAQQGDECLACHTGLPATMENVIAENSETQPVASNACDYSSADLFGGWGWNPITQESCAPLTDEQSQVASSCDYSNAASFGGWGWDPVAGESCPPVEGGGGDPHANFPICSAAFYDADNDGFGWENEASCIITSQSEPAPVFVNRETGNQVNLLRANWDGNADIANRTIQCDLYYYDSYNNRYQLEPVPFRSGANLNNQVFPSYRFTHQALPLVAPYLGPISEVAYVDGSSVTPTSFGTTAQWTTDDGRYLGPTVLQSPYIEQITLANGYRGIRTWHESRFDTALNLQFSGNRVQNDGFFECRDISGRDLVPTRGANTNSTQTQCDYSNAASFGGWGWNSVTRQSCAPQQQQNTVTATNNCDYSNAGQSGGWGWNSVTRQSCPPVTNNTTQPNTNDGCDYSNAGTNGGWGWNNATGQSCAPR